MKTAVQKRQNSPAFPNIEALNREVVACRRCPRLVSWTQTVGCTKRKAYQSETYWAQPVPSFGDPQARVLVVGLAPGAHGANRTGRMFTGDRSGEWLYRALFDNGFSNTPTSSHRSDSLKLTNLYISAIVRCAPPQNKPSRGEVLRCLSYLVYEIPLLRNVRVIVALGSLAWKESHAALAQLGYPVRRPTFAHGATSKVGPYDLLGSYHPSQQNTFTGRLTRAMLNSVFSEARRRSEN